MIDDPSFAELKPDLVTVKSLFDGSCKIFIIELTVPFESNISNAHNRKMDKYKNLNNHLNDRPNIKSKLICIEIGPKITRND